MSPVEFLQGARLSRTQRALLGLLLLLAAASTTIGVQNAIHRSQDFQWSGARILLGHQDPWAEYLSGDPRHRFVLSQVPNYLAILYVLIAPVGLLPMMWANLLWATCNVVFAAVSATVAARFYGLRSWTVFAVVCLMLMATPTRNSIGNGQQGLLVLMIWCLSLLSWHLSASRVALAGVSFLKFSFAPPLALFLLLRSGLHRASLSLVPAVASIGIVWLWITGGHRPESLPRIAVEPFKVAVHGFVPDPGDPNLMSLLESALRGWPGTLIASVTAVVALSICACVCYFAILRHREASVEWQLALVATMSFALFKHHAYDGVVLLLPACHALRRHREWRGKVVLAVIFYSFYAQRAAEALHLHPTWAAVPEFGMLMMVLAMTYQMRVPQQIQAEAELLPHLMLNIARPESRSDHERR